MEQISIREHSFNLFVAMEWWKGNQEECRCGHFNLELYLSYMNQKYKS